MLPASRTIALRQTSKTNTLTSLSLYLNNLGEGGGRALAEALRLNSTLTSLDLGYNDLGEGGGRALAETLRLNSTLKSLNLVYNGLREGGGRALAEALRLNTSLTSLKLMMMYFIFNNNDLREEVQSALAQAWGDRGGSLEL